MEDRAPITVDEAQQRLIALADPVAVERVPLALAAGRWAADPIAALRTQPERALSAMDGYAIRFADLGGAMTVIGESAAGRPFTGAIGAGQATRIFTGAIVPDGADTILIQEEARREGDVLTLAGEGPPAIGAHIRERGLDFTTGEIVIERGDRLTPARIALAAIAGHGTLPVRRHVRVAIAATGDELVPAGDPLAIGQLPESNGVMLAAMLADLPVDLIDMGILPDDLAVLTRRFAQVDADILVTTGGASVGDHDLVRPALIAAGATIDFWRIAMRPGKPVMAGRRGAMVALGLPGNPVSAFVTAQILLRPLVAAYGGATDARPAIRRLPLAEPLPANGPRADYGRGSIVDGQVVPAPRQDSSMLRRLAVSTVLIVRLANAPAAERGDMVDILDLA